MTWNSVCSSRTLLLSSSSETPWLLWCPNHGRHSPQSHLSQPLHPHRKCGQWPQCGFSQHGESVSTKPLSHLHRNPQSGVPAWHVPGSERSLQSTTGLVGIQPVSGTIQISVACFLSLMQRLMNVGTDSMCLHASKYGHTTSVLVWRKSCQEIICFIKELPLLYVGLEITESICVNNCFLSSVFDHRLSDAKTVTVLLFSTFNNRGHGRVALWKSASNHCRVFLHALEMNSENCLEVFFYIPCIESKITKKTITLFGCMQCNALCLMHNWWASTCLFPEGEHVGFKGRMLTPKKYCLADK